MLQNGISLSFGLKVPFGFPCLAHVCLSNSFGFVCFSTAYVTLVVALLFGSLVLLLLLYCYCYEYYYHSYNLTVTAVHMLQSLWSWFAGRSGGNITSLKVKSCNWSFFGGQSLPLKHGFLQKVLVEICCNILHILLLLGRDVHMSCKWPWF